MAADLRPRKAAEVPRAESPSGPSRSSVYGGPAAQPAQAPRTTSTTASDVGGASQPSSFMDKLSSDQSGLKLPSFDWAALDAPQFSSPSMDFRNPPSVTIATRRTTSSNDRRYRRADLTTPGTTLASRGSSQHQQQQQRLSSFPCVGADGSSVDFARSDSSSEWCPPSQSATGVVMSSAPPSGFQPAPPAHLTSSEAPSDAPPSRLGISRPRSGSSAQRENNAEDNSMPAKGELGVEDYSRSTGPNSFFRSYLKHLSKRADDIPPPPLSDSRRRLRRANSGASSSGLERQQQLLPPQVEEERHEGCPRSEQHPELLEQHHSSSGREMPPQPIAPADASLGASGGSVKVRQQLAAMAGQIRGFESQLLTEIEQRKQASAGRLAVVRDAVTQLRRTLEVEINRRIEMQKELHTSLNREVVEMRAGAAAALEERRQATESLAEELRSRVAAAENAAFEQLGQNEEKLARISQAVDLMATQIDSFKNRLTSDIQLRRQRSDVLFEKLAELERASQSRVAMETGLRERDKEALVKQVVELRQEQQAATAKLQEKLAKEFRELKETLERETKTREQADDDIVKALNHYTVALQNALRIANA